MIYKTVFGIETGDVMSIGSGANRWSYEVIDITRPVYTHDVVYYLAVHTLPVFTLVGGVPPSAPNYATDHGRISGRINDVRCQDGRYYRHDGEIIIEKPSRYPDRLIDMFESQVTTGEPYVWQDGVDYAAPDHTLFNCKQCGLDFNTATRIRSIDPLPPCPRCQWISRPILVFDYSTDPPKRLNGYARSMGRHEEDSHADR